MSRLENFKIDLNQDDYKPPYFVPNSVIDTLKRNLAQAEYPNSKLNEPINNYKLFHPNLKQDNRARDFYISNYDEKVMDYNAPQMDRINIKSKHPYYDINNADVIKYNDTKPKINFAKPLKTNGINKLDYLDCKSLNKNTFKFERYGHRINSDNIDNPLYYSNISDETRYQYGDYFNKIADRNDNILNGVLEDISILQFNNLNKIAKDTTSTNNYDSTDANIDSQLVKIIQKTY
jgi:hypothetical protein